MNQYSFIGNGNILIKAGITGKYGNRNFAAGEPIAYFTDVSVELVFSNEDKIASQGINNLTSDSKSEPSILRVQNVKTTSSLQSLLYKKQNNSTKHKTEVKKLTSSGGVMFLPLSTDDVLVQPLFIYDDSQSKMGGYTVSGENSILGLPNGTYTVFYSVDRSANSTFSLETPSMPNMSVEVSVEGNLNGQNGLVVMHLKNAKLLSRPTLNFNSANPFVDTLEFVIHKDKEAIEVNYYG